MASRETGSNAPTASTERILKKKEDYSAGIALRSRAEDAWQSLAPGTRAGAVLVREASMLEVWCGGLCQGSPNQAA